MVDTTERRKIDWMNFKTTEKGEIKRMGGKE